MSSSRLGLLGGLVVVLLTGCGRAAFSGKSMAAPPPPPMEGQAAVAEAAPVPDGVVPADAPAPAPAAEAPSRAAEAPGGATSAEATSSAAPREMLDIEAHLSLMVDSVSDARSRLRKQVTARGATITSDVAQEASGVREAALTIRVPAGASDQFLDEVERLGDVVSRQMNAKDIGREFHDSEIVLHNLQRTLARYEEILQKAQGVDEILRIENELSRIRGQIDRVKGDLSYMGDRAARATVYLVIHERSKEIAQSEPETVKFYPGLRAVALTQLRGARSTVSAFGGGVTVGAGRKFNIELDALKRVSSGSNALDVVLVTIGGDTYSDLLGAGKRRFLNPYLGLRAGYARVSGANDLTAGATLGTEIWKNDYATIDADLRVLGLFGSDGAEIGLQPTLGANVAF